MNNRVDNSNSSEEELVDESTNGLEPEASPREGEDGGLSKLVESAPPEQVIVGVEYYTDKIGGPDNTGRYEYRIGKDIVPDEHELTVTSVYFGGKRLVRADRLDAALSEVLSDVHGYIYGMYYCGNKGCHNKYRPKEGDEKPPTCGNCDVKMVKTRLLPEEEIKERLREQLGEVEE